MAGIGINVSDREPTIGWEAITHSQRHITPELRDAEAEECAAWKAYDSLVDDRIDGKAVELWQIEGAREKANACQARTLELRRQYHCRHLHTHDEGKIHFDGEPWDDIHTVCDDCGYKDV